MSLLALLCLGSIACAAGLLIAIAFARAVLYANVLTELDCTRELPRAARVRNRAPAADVRPRSALPSAVLARRVPRRGTASV